MPKQKSKLIGFLLAVFTGPVSYLYVGKWKKTLLLFPLMIVPYVNAGVYVITLFAIISDVKNYNKQNFNEVRYGLVVCKCGAHNKACSNYCSDCGNELTKNCRKCNAFVLINKNYCNYCGFAFKDMIKKTGKWKKPIFTVAIGLVLVIAMYLTFFVAVEQQQKKTAIQNLTLVNFEFPATTKADRFHIHYELSEKKPLKIEGLKTFINGTYVYANDSEAKFDGKSIDWIVHLKKKGPIRFNVTLYHYDRLLDSRQLSINVTA